MPPSAAPPSLVLLSRPLTGARFAFDDGLDEATIGSDESCRFYLNLPQVSPVHARLWLEQDVIMVVDTQSRTGVYVNDDRVVGKGALHSGDVLWLGPPGEETSIMLQVWVPPPSSARPVSKAPADPADATVVMMAPRRKKDPADSTVVMMAPSRADPADSTLVMELEEVHAEEVLVEAEPEPEPPPPPRREKKEEAANKTVFFQASPDAFRADLTLPATPAPRVPEPAAAKPSERAKVAAKAPVAPRTGTSPLVWVGLAAGVLLLMGAGAFFALRGGPSAEPPATVASGGVAAPDAPATATGAVPRPAPIYEEVETVVPGARPSLAPPPTTLAVAPPTLEAAPGVTMAAAAPVAPPDAAPIVSAPDLVARADGAVTAGRFDEAVGLYDQALQLDPQLARARQGRANAAALRKSFATTPTKFIGRPKKGVPVGFEGEAPDPAYQGRISFEFMPAHVKPGDTFVVRAFLHNEGQKQIDVDNIQMLTIIDGRTGKAPPARKSKVAPGQRVLLGEHATTWREVKAWVMEVRAVSKRKESYWSRVTWR